MRDQADGLRRLFVGNGVRHIPLVANPHIAMPGLAIERLAAMLLELGQRTLVVDAADSAPAVAESSALGLASCVEPLTPQLAYLAARGLPRRYVDTRGSAARLLDELCTASPSSNVILVHAEITDLARIFKHRPARPVLLAADQPEAVKHAYAAWKLLAARCEWLSADLLLLAAPQSPRTPHIAASLAQCADTFMGAVLKHWADIDPDGEVPCWPDPALRSLVAAQLELDDATAPHASSPQPGPRDAALSAARH
ncbi:MAG: flagellar biosynthesis protein [Rubrivivax sp.]|nr:flagellar biosynthesis protein [Rubrivivax sp.]